MNAVLLAILLNQLGFYPHAPKMAIVTEHTQSSQFYIVTVSLGDTVYSGVLGDEMASANSSLRGRQADFTAFEKEGVYKIVVPGLASSYPFRIDLHVAAPVARAALKGYYYQRSAMPLEERYAGVWSRDGGHPDTQVLVHPSAAGKGRPALSVISTPGGWYDAGDYNKYIVNSGITMGTLLSAYEDFPAFFDTLHTNIPPMPGVPDILNESLYNLRWMLCMQDPADGGVYNKCTNATFDGMVQPGVTKAARYVVQKGTAATLDFAAVMAQASRLLRKFPGQLPGLADSCLAAARYAWAWAVKNPALIYDQGAMNKIFSPAIITGGYGDNNMRDEWYWAAVELMITTGSAAFPDSVQAHIHDPAGLPSWANVHMMGDYSLLRHRATVPASMVRPIQQHLLQMADEYLARAQRNVFHTVMGGRSNDFMWGSNSVAANQGMLLIYAWLVTHNRKYVDYAIGNLDHILGRNATGYCFITGMGSFSPLHIHHRQSVSDGIAAPVPGLLAGGPNPGRQDHQSYTLTEPETAYLDNDQAYASNEIAINWNAPLVYLAGAIEAIFGSAARR